MAKQRYSYLGLIIVLAMLLIVAWLIGEAFEHRSTVVVPTPEVNALRMQCDERNGILAVSSADWTWVECYQGKRKLWGVRL